MRQSNFIILLFIYSVSISACKNFSEQEGLPVKLDGNWYDENNGQLVMSFDEEIAFISDIYIFDPTYQRDQDNTFRIADENRHFDFQLNGNKIRFGDKTLVKQASLKLLKEGKTKNLSAKGLATVRGFIRQFDDSLLYEPIKVVTVDDILMVEKEYFYGYDSSGFFSFSVPLSHVQNILIQFSSDEPFRKLLLVPGDTLNIILENHNAMHAGFQGKYALSNYNLWDFEAAYKKVYDQTELSKAYSQKPSGFYETMRQRMTRSETFSDEFCKGQPCSETFRAWMESDMKVRELRNIFLYRQQSIHSTDTATIYDWQSALPDIDLNDSFRWSSLFPLLVNSVSNSEVNPIEFDLKSRKKNYEDILNNEVLPLSPAESILINKLYKNPALVNSLSDKDEMTLSSIENRFSNELKDNRDKAFYSYYIEAIAESKSDGLHEFALTALYYRWVFTLEDKKNHEYLYSLINPLVESSDVQNKLDSLYFLASRETTDVTMGNNMNTVEGSVEVLLRQIRDTRQGEEIFLDIWATWCKPCLSEFRDYNKFFPPIRDRTYVFLCLDSNPEQWAALINKFNIPGEHYLASDKQSDELKKRWDITSIPFKVIIDNKGKVRKLSK